MTSRQRNIITGLLLGDGHLEQNGRYVRLKVDQACAHADYINWLYGELKNLISKCPVLISEKDKRTGKIYERLHFATRSVFGLQQWHDAFYRNRKKIVPPNIGQLLRSNITLAVWLMDDGYKRNDCAAIRLNTDSFSYDENRKLIRCLEKNFKIKSHLHRKGKWFNIYIPKHEALKFSFLVKPYVLPSFRHKLL